MNLRVLILIALVALTPACAKLDDYMLGKDNTPKPKDLAQINSKVQIKSNWVAPMGKAHKTKEYLKIKPIALGNTLYTADSSGLVQAISKNEGKVQWSTYLKQGIVTGPTVADGYLAVGTNDSSLVVLSQSKGNELWQSKVSAEILSPPAISKHKVVAKTIDGKVFTFDADNGKNLWTVDHGSPSLVLKASSSPVILDNLVLVGFSDGKLDALDLDTGRTIWERSIAYSMGASDVERLIDIDADPIVHNQVAYLASYQGYIGALSLTDGQFLWKKSGSVYKNMVLKNNTLYFTDSNDVLWSLDSRTGHVNWKQTALKARGLTEPVILGTDLVVGDKSGYLHLIESQTGELLARSQLPAGVSSAPQVVGRNMYVLTDNGMLNQLSVS